MSNSALASGREIQLLMELTSTFPRWGVWKNAESAMSGEGDIDSVAPRQDWNAITESFVRWGSPFDLGPFFSCRHLQAVLLLVGVDRAGGGLCELDVAAYQPFRGGPLFRAGDLDHMMVMDQLGFRRLRPGSEGLLLLVLSGVRRGGRPNTGALKEKRIAERLRSDPEGIKEAAALFGWAGGAVVHLADAVCLDRWSWLSALVVEAHGVGRALTNIRILVERLRLWPAGKVCSITKTLIQHRGSPPNLDAWIEQVSADHEALTVTS